MKVLVILSLVALCYSTPLTAQKRVTVGEDGTIIIKGTQGREIDIYRSVVDPGKLNIIIKTQFGTVRKIQIDEIADIKNVDINTLDARFFKNLPRDQVTQANILVHIFREFEGLVDEPTYKILLGRIETLVKEGYLHQAVLEALKTLDQLRMVDDLKQDEAKDLMDDIVREKLIEDVEYPVSQWRKVSGGEGVFGLNQFKNHGVQGLWNIDNWTPFQRQMLLQHMRQVQYEQGLGDEVLPIELLREEALNRDLTHQQIMHHILQQKLEQTEISPLNRYLHKVALLKGQGFYNPQQFRIPQFQGRYQYQQFVPQQWEQLDDLPQSVERFVEQDRFAPKRFERVFEQGRFVPQDIDYAYGRFPIVY